LSYLPLAHIFEKVVSFSIFSVGGRIGFYGGDTLKLKDVFNIFKFNI
jgi:long-chain acyl-CoA synthetase